MKKIVIFLLSVILTLNCVNLAANDYIYGEKNTPTRSESEMCEIRIFMWSTGGTGWYTNAGIVITVDGVDYGTIKLPYAFEIYEGEETVLIPSGEVLFSWKGQFDAGDTGFKIYNSLGELIYTSPNYPNYLIPGLFFTYQNECVACLPLTDFEGVYIQEKHQVNLSWIAPESADVIGFDIFRNDEFLEHLPDTITFYSDYTAELEDGDYKYCVIPVYPSVCTLDDECFETYISNVGIADYKDNILIYPNPANNVISITGDRVSNLKIYNNIGQLILTQHNTNTINVSTLINGLYLLTIELTTGQTTQKKLIINH